MKPTFRFFAGLSLSLALFATLQGCVTRLDQGQLQELSVYEHKNLVVYEKSPVAAGIVGVLPSAGYFYTGHPVLAISTIPLYPFLGPLWMPFDAVAAAQSRNYYATVMQVKRDEARDKKLNDQALMDKKIDYTQHMQAERKIEDAYAGF